ncbi:DUF5074 domain-containing protein [Viscerimonas tarda]
MKTKNLLLAFFTAAFVAVSFSSCNDDDVSGNTNQGIPQSPRSLTAYNGKVYVSYFDGYLARIDTARLTVDAQVKVGRCPEYVRVANNKLYVANSGGLDFNNELGYDKTVSVIDPVSFTRIKDIEVALNPDKLAVDSKGNVYVISNGNYGDVQSALQKIDAATGEVKKLGLSASYMTIYNDKLYLIDSQYDENWNTINTFLVYDTKTESLITDSFVTDGTEVSNPYSISVNPSNGDVYIGSSDYVTDGDMYIFNQDGQLIKKFDTKGLNPIGAYSQLSGKGMYILNSGNINSNDANLAFFNFQSDAVEYDVYATQNGRGMGDTAQDLLVYGSKVYVAMSGSALIYVLDKQGKEISVIRSAR